MTGLHELLDTAFIREMAAKAEDERAGQIAWMPLPEPYTPQEKP